jgi:ADP-dependent NAD(P)H-hydrate dehydratase
VTTPATRLTLAVLRRCPLPDPSDGESKEDRGRVLVVGGSRQTPGAIRLAGVAALRAGAGKLQVACGADVAVALGIALPEAKVVGLAVDQRGQIESCNGQVLKAAQQTDSLLIGPGMDDCSATGRVAARLLRATGATTILDAGALRAYRGRRSAAVILTPHLGEMAWITGMSSSQLSRRTAEVARKFAREQKVTLVLKGPRTHVASADGRLWIHEDGSVGLGTSGSGDVLAGVIAGLVARGARPEQAAIWGVWLHGKAGTALSARQGLIGFLASEIAAEIPALLR